MQDKNDDVIQDLHDCRPTTTSTIGTLVESYAIDIVSGDYRGNPLWECIMKGCVNHVTILPNKILELGTYHVFITDSPTTLSS